MRELKELSKWSTRFLRMAQMVASWSKDPSTKVGCIIVDNDKRVVSMGFNGPPAGCSDAAISRERKLLSSIHAEDNALLFAHRNVRGFTAYVTAECCGPCMVKLLQAGITAVVVLKSELPARPPWDVSCSEAEIRAKEKGIEYFCIKEENLI